MKKRNFLYIGLIAVAVGAFGCKKSYLDTVPQDALSSDNLYKTTTGCYDVLDGMARLMSTTGSSLTVTGGTARHDDFGAKAIDLGDDCMGQDMVCNANGYDWFSTYYNYTGAANYTYAVDLEPWAFYYKIINHANLILANINQTVGDQSAIDDIKGEAYAYRAWAYYKLTVYYCKTYSRDGATNPGVPVYTEPTTAQSVGKGRGTVADVYKRIVADCDSATTLLATGVNPRAGNISYMTAATANGIYAKVALVMENWTLAAEKAATAINLVGGAGKLMDAATYQAGFSTPNNEWMWGSQLSASQTDDYGIICFLSFVDANRQGTYASGGDTWRKIANALYTKIPAADVRKSTFVSTGADTRKQTKFRLVSTALWTYQNLYMRLGEMYLIQAEAQAHSDEAAATATLETLVKKRNPNYDATAPYFTGTVPSGSTKLLEEIYLQRRIELFLEGQSYSDIQRLRRGLDRPTTGGNFSAITAIVTSLPAMSNKFLFKIPVSELNTNPNITAADQNPN